jgi:hypothetical protein
VNRGLLPALLAIAGLGFGLLADASGGTSPRHAATPGKVLVRTSGRKSETHKTIPISRHGGAKKRVVMTMGAHRLPDLMQGDKLAVTAELQVTDDCFFRQSRCVGPRPYSYSPILDAKLVLARGRKSTGGRHAMPLTGRKRHVCLAGIPNREHHCVMVFRHGGTHVGSGGLPCAASRCRINLVLSAHNPKAKRGNRLIIGGSPPDGSVSQDRGRVNAIIFRPGSQPRPKPAVTKNLRHKSLPLDEKFRVVYSKRLPGLDAGDQISVDGHATVNDNNLPYNARVSSQLVLADHPTQTHPGRIARRVAQGGPEISESNGFNCVHPRSPCTYHKVGVARIGHDARNHAGDRVPLYVNLTMLNTPKRTEGSPGDRLRLVDRGAIRVSRYEP